MDRHLELYKKAAELAKIGIWELNIADNKLFWDYITKKIFEVEEDFEPVLADALSLYIKSTEFDSLEDQLRKTILTGEALAGELQVKTLKNNIIWIEINSQADFEDGKCVRLVGTIQDITQRRRLIETLELNHNKFSGAFDYAPIGMALVSPEGKWMKVNNSLCNILGYSTEELMVTNFQTITHPDDLATDLIHVYRLLNKEDTTYSMEKRYFHKDGRIVWVLLTVALVWNADDTPLYFISQLKDITEIKKNTDKLYKERQRLNNVIESTQIGTWEWNIALNKFTHDERCFRMLGYSLGEIGLNKPEELAQELHRDDIDGIKQHLDDCFDKKTDYYHHEYRMRHKDGSWIWIASHGKVIKWSADNKPLVMLGTREDISKRKQIEEVQLKTMAIISDQNKRLINFAHIVSHNLRSHAGNFQMLLELLNMEEDEAEKVHMLNLLHQNAENLSETISNLNEVVSFQLNDKKQTKSINLHSQIKKTLTAIQAIAERQEAKFLVMVDENLNLNYNPAYLESILLNFFTNSIKYRHPDRNPEISIKSFIEDGRIILEVKDNGLGIDLQLHGKKLFGMYKTFHDHADARGIGLFITKQQIEALGGTVTVESEVNVGTTFKLSFLN